MKTTFSLKSLRKAAAAAAGILLACAAVPAQDRSESAGLSPKTISVFINGPEAAFYRAEIPFVVHVENRDAALVLIEISPGSDAEGAYVSLVLTGRKDFEGLRDSLKVRLEGGEPADRTRENVARTLKLGLMKFITKTDAASRIEITFQDQVKPTAVVCPWNFWVFSLGANGMLDGESSYRSRMWLGNLSASRVTPEWKIRFGANVNVQKNVYAYEGFDYESTSDSRSLQGLVVRSLGDHWSIGATVAAGASTYSNKAFSLIPMPAVEYDVFRYSESTRKQLRILYAVGPEFVRYREETIYDKRRETLWSESLTVTLDLKRPWGSMSVSLAGSHYFHDLKKNRLNLDGEISWRIFKGLNFNISGGGARVRDQLSLPKGGASLEEVLLRRRQIETGYNYFFMVGLSYTFGSVHSNVVNPRFGNGGGGIMISL